MTKLIWVALRELFQKALLFSELVLLDLFGIKRAVKHYFYFAMNTVGIQSSEAYN